MKPGPKPRLTAQERRDKHAEYMRDWRKREKEKIQALKDQLDALQGDRLEAMQAQLEKALAETE